MVANFRAGAGARGGRARAALNDARRHVGASGSPAALLLALLRDERGAEVVEWIGLGGLLVLIVAGIHASLYGSGGAAIRAALTGSVARTAITFGGDVNAPLPRLPQRQPPRPGDPYQRDGAYVVLDDASGERAYLRPGPDTEAIYDPASGRLQLADAGRGLFAALDPLSGRATLVDPVTGAPRGVGLADLEGLGLVEVGRDSGLRTDFPPADQLLRMITGG